MEWGFDPRTNKGHLVLKSELGRIIWGGIKTNHIVDQYFNDNCYALLKRIKKTPPENVESLISMAYGCNLGGYGRIFDQHKSLWQCNVSKPDMEFWGEMFNALTGKLKIEMKYPDVISKN